MWDILALDTPKDQISWGAFKIFILKLAFSKKFVGFIAWWCTKSKKCTAFYFSNFLVSSLFYSIFGEGESEVYYSFF